MLIEFMTNLSEPIQVDKTVVSLFTLEGTLRNESPISSPSILIATNDLLNNAPRVNYAHIPAFGRYYYIQEITHQRDNLWIVDMVCDVLMSFATNIRNSQAIVENTSLELTNPEINNRYMSVDSYATAVKRKTDIIQFPQGFGDAPYYILITAGGVANE